MRITLLTNKNYVDISCIIIFSVLLQMVYGITASAPAAVPRGGASSGSSSSSNNGGGGRDDNNVPLVGLGPDPFVSAAPLIVAAVCSDGVILAALHTIFADEPLLLLSSSSSSSSASAKEKEDDNEDSHDDDDIKKNQSDTKTTTTTTVIKDLPRGYRGPFRIHSIDGYGTALTSTGWRADTHIMTDYSRLVAAEELEIYGSPTTIPGKQYGQVLSNDISSWMAQCAISDQTRSLSCVGLLATCCGRRRGSSNNRNNDDALGGGYLWLIDATGSYRVRAHAVGTNAGYVNSKLETIDWTRYNKEEAARDLVKLLSEELLDNDRIPSEACIELAYISSSSSSGDDEKSFTTTTTEKRRLERLFTSRLFLE